MIPVQGTITETLISTVKVKRGFYFRFDTDKYCIVNVDYENNLVDAVKITNGQKAEVSESFDIEDVDKRIIRYKINTNRGSKVYNYEVDFKDYDIVEDGVSYEGFLEKVHTSLKLGDKVIITDIDIIDKYELYAKAERYATVCKPPKQFTIEVQLNNKLKILEARRDSIQVVEGNDYNMVFHPKCNFCER